MVDAAKVEGIILTDMRPFKFIFLFPSADLRYTGALSLAQSRSLEKHAVKYQKVSEEMRHGDLEMAGYHSQFWITYCREDDPARSPQDPDFVQLEKNWYGCVDQDDLGSHNVYSLGVLLFELLCLFESEEKHYAAMADLSRLILPEQILAEEPKAAGFCLRLLNPATRPSTEEILATLAEYIFEESDESSEEDTESDEVLEFLASLKERKEKRMARIDKNLTEINQHGKSYEPVIPWSFVDHISQMETMYFSMKSERPDTEILNEHAPNVANHKELDHFQGVSKFEACGTWWNSDLMTTQNSIYSLSFDRDERLIAAARASRKIQILEFASLLDDSLDLPCTSVEMNNDSRLTCICWNKYLQNYLASSDYAGVVKIWDASTGQEVNRYKEHKKIAWQVDTSRVNPTWFASASEDGTVKLWSMSQLGSTATIYNRYNLCSVQYSRHSLNLLAIGSATGEVLCYDLRNTRAPWCTLASHKKPVTFVRFLDSETLVSSSTESTMKIWDLKKSRQDGPSTNACTLTLTGHRNTMHFLGLSDFDGYLACGSETNEVFVYHRSFPMPITTHAFGSVSELVRDEATDLHVTSVCWGSKSGMLVAGNSTGSIKVLRLV